MGSGFCHAVLAASVSEARTDEYGCDSNIDEDRSFVLLLGNDASAAGIQISRYYKLCTEDNIYELLLSTTILVICRMEPSIIYYTNDIIETVCSSTMNDFVGLMQIPTRDECIRCRHNDMRIVNSRNEHRNTPRAPNVGPALHKPSRSVVHSTSSAHAIRA